MAFGSVVLWLLVVLMGQPSVQLAKGTVSANPRILLKILNRPLGKRTHPGERVAARLLINPGAGLCDEAEARRAAVPNNRIFMQIQFSDHTGPFGHT
jgi:hypothetical protein